MQSVYTNIDMLDVGFGSHNTRRVAALGTNPGIDTGTVPEDMWPGGGLYPWMTGATALEMVSTSASDSAAGVGARAVAWNLLNTSYVEAPIIAATNGLTPVPVSSALATQFFRVNPSGIVSAGSTEVNVGDIILRDAGGGTIRAIIPAGSGQTQQAVYTVPAGWAMQLLTILLGYNRVQNVARSATFAHYARSSLGFYRLSNELSVTNEQPFQLETVPGALLAEKTDFSIRCTFVADNDSNLSGSFVGIMKKTSPGIGS